MQLQFQHSESLQEKQKTLSTSSKNHGAIDMATHHFYQISTISSQHPQSPDAPHIYRQLSGLTGTTTFTVQDSFLGTTITLQQEPHTISFTIFNLYSPGRPEPLVALLPLLSIPTNFMIMGDLNAHHPWWQDPLPHTARTSPASHTIIHWLEHNNFHLQNEPAIPTHHPRNRSSPSTINLCLTCGDTTRCTLPLAIKDNTTSDHSSLTATLLLPYTSPPPKPYRCWNKADWNSFNSHIQSVRIDLSELQGPEVTLRVISNITLLIHQATEIAVPYKDPRKSTTAHAHLPHQLGHGIQHGPEACISLRPEH